jgi:hypothetical protein
LYDGPNDYTCGIGIKNQKAGLPVYFGNPAILLSLKWLVSFYSTNQLKVNKTRGFPFPDFSGFGFINKKNRKAPSRHWDVLPGASF